MAKAERIPFHELANIFPLMSGESFDALVADIEAHGLREPIVKFKGKVVDGRNRYNACLKAGKEPYFVEWDEQGSLLDFIVSVNFHRRHLTESQRAIVAANIANLSNGEHKDKSSCASPIGEAGISQADAAALLNVGKRSVERAAKVLESSPQEVIDAVTAGDVKVSDAAAVSDLSTREQKAAVKAVESGKAKTLKAASKQVVTGRKSSDAPKPPANGKATGDFAEIETAIGKLSRAVDKLAEKKNCLNGNHHRGIVKAIEATAARINEWKRSRP